METSTVANQHDDHIWLTVKGEAYAIYKIDWPLIILWRGYAPHLEFTAVSMENFDAERYVSECERLLDEARAREHASS
jgi:hypothetical protein